MAGRVGMDAALVRQAAAAIDTSAGDVERVTGDVDGLVARIAGSWSGDAEGQFHEAWTQTHRPALRSLGEALHRFAALACTNADAQEHSSAAEGGFEFSLGAVPTILAGAALLAKTLSHRWSDVGRYSKSWERVLRDTPPSWGNLLRWKRSPVLHWVNDLDRAGGPAAHVLDSTRSLAHGADSFLKPAATLFDGAQFGIDLAHGDRLGAGLDGLSVIADQLKNKPTPVSYLGGVALQSWVQAGRAARNVDWSAEGMSEIRHASPRDWADAFGGAIKQMPGQLLTIF